MPNDNDFSTREAPFKAIVGRIADLWELLERRKEKLLKTSQEIDRTRETKLQEAAGSCELPTIVQMSCSATAIAAERS